MDKRPEDPSQKKEFNWPIDNEKMMNFISYQGK